MRLLLLVTVVLSVAVFLTACQPSGGSSTYQVPPTVNVSEPVPVTLVLVCWGRSARGEDRFRDVRLSYKGPSDNSFAMASPVSTSVDHPSTSIRNYTRVTFTFTIPPGSTGTKGQVEYYFSWKFDNVENRTGGKLPISVVEAGNDE